MYVSGREICFVNIEQFWFEHHPAGQKLQSVVPLAFFIGKKTKKYGSVVWKADSSGLVIDLPKIRKVFSLLECKFLYIFT